VLIIIGALFNHWGAMAPVLWVLAVLSTITVAHRIVYTYHKLARAPDIARRVLGHKRLARPVRHAQRQ
jgi:hypothetical protein